MSDIIRDYVARAIEEKMVRDEAIIRSLLGRWVSELEPSVAYRNNEVIGLCVADATLDSIPWILKIDDPP